MSTSDVARILHVHVYNPTLDQRFIKTNSIIRCTVQAPNGDINPFDRWNTCIWKLKPNIGPSRTPTLTLISNDTLHVRDVYSTFTS